MAVSVHAAAAARGHTHRGHSREVLPRLEIAHSRAPGRSPHLGPQQHARGPLRCSQPTWRLRVTRAQYRHDSRSRALAATTSPQWPRTVVDHVVANASVARPQACACTVQGHVAHAQLRLLAHDRCAQCCPRDTRKTLRCGCFASFTKSCPEPGAPCCRSLRRGAVAAAAAALGAHAELERTVEPVLRDWLDTGTGTNALTKLAKTGQMDDALKAWSPTKVRRTPNGRLLVAVTLRCARHCLARLDDATVAC